MPCGAKEAGGVYRPRHPQQSPFYQLVERFYPEFEALDEGMLMDIEVYPRIASDGQSVDLEIRPSVVSTNTPIHPALRPGTQSGSPPSP
ncbi:MAG: hypothetical protein FJ387_25490 [Verrucomicrobia bacterium]|nr:hypothetical protein [Verrucomicrobiota bacterium]